MVESGSLLRSCVRKGTVGSNPTLSEKLNTCFLVFVQVVPIAQLDRALDCGSRGRRFESSWARKELVKKGGWF